MANEGIFNDLNLNPLIVVDDDNDSQEPENQDDDVNLSDENTPNPDNSDDKKGQNQNRSKKTETVIEVDDEETEEATPLSKNTKDDDSASDDETDSKLKDWITFYKEKGMIAEDLDESTITNSEELFEKLQEQQLNTANALVESYKSQLPKEIRDLVESWEDGAEGEAFKKVLGLKAEQIEFSKLDAEKIKGNVELQKSVVRNYMKRTSKFDDAKIEKYIKKLEDLEELEEEAASNAGELKTLAEAEQAEIRKNAKEAEAARIQNAQKQRAELQQYIKDTKAIIPELNITEGERKELENFIFNPVAKDQAGNPVFYVQKLFNEDPKGMAVKINYLAVVTKGFTDWSKLQKKVETKVNKKVDTLLDSGPPKSNKQRGSSEDNSWRENLKRLQR